MAAITGGILSDQIKMYAAVIPASGSGAVINDPSTWTKANLKDLFPASSGTQVQLKQLQAIPSLGGTTNKVDVTCLEDTAKKYINGLKDYGDSIDFTFLYDNTPTTGNYSILDSATYKDINTAFQISFKEGENFFFVGREMPAFAEVAVDSALTFTMSVALQTEIFYDPITA